MRLTVNSHAYEHVLRTSLTFTTHAFNTLNARLLTRRGDYDGALKVLNLVDSEKLGGSWRGSMRLSRSRTLEAAGRKADALKSYRDVAADKSALESHRRAAEKAVAALESGN